MRLAFALNEYVPSHPTNAAPVMVSALPATAVTLILSSRTPEPSKRRSAVASRNGLAVRDAINDGHRAETDRPRVFARQVELTAEQARYRVVVESEGMPQALDITPDDPEPRVQLFATIAAVTEREKAVSPDLRLAASHDPVGDRHVAALDDDSSGPVPPLGVPRSDILPREHALDARPPERRRPSRRRIPPGRRIPRVVSAIRSW